MSRIRVLVVEDSATVRNRLVEIFRTDSEFEVVGDAGDGKSAIELCRSLRPDVMTLDMMLPVMTGLAATEYIMAYCPTPILIVSASTNRGELFRTYDALAAGAVDVLEKPLGTEGDGEWEGRFLSTVKLVSRIKVITHPRGRLSPRAATLAPRSSTTSLVTIEGSEVGPTRVVGIGASTGGAGAVATILRGLPKDYPLPILLVVHIGKMFAGVFAEWLDSQSPLRVAHATHGQPLANGRVTMAPPDRHLTLSGGRVLVSDGPERHSCRPSVDVLFESLALEAGAEAAACLLTGMGRDGADGLLRIRSAGGRTFAQDEATSVVFGMPREAILLGAAERILPLDAFAPALAELAP